MGEGYSWDAGCSILFVKDAKTREMCSDRTFQAFRNHDDSVLATLSLTDKQLTPVSPRATTIRQLPD
jgi:hypothetical protein